MHLFPMSNCFYIIKYVWIVKAPRSMCEVKVYDIHRVEKYTCSCCGINTFFIQIDLTIYLPAYSKNSSSDIDSTFSVGIEFKDSHTAMAFPANSSPVI